MSLDPEQGLENPFVALASRERYSTLAPYSDKASQLQIRTIEVAPQQYLVRLTGPALAAGEAFNFALELSWPSGKVVREYRVSGGAPVPGQPGKKEDSSAALAERHPLIDEPGGLAFGEGRLLSARGLPMRAEIELLGDWPATISAASFTLSSDENALDKPKLVLHQRKGRQWLAVSSSLPLQQTRVAFNLEARHDGAVIQRGFVFTVPQRGVYLGKLPAKPAVQAMAMRGQYRVQPGDTLSGLARRFAHDQPVSQAENALYAANPAAFAHGDRNRLFAGAVLNVPEVAAPASAVAANAAEGSDAVAKPLPAKLAASAVAATPPESSAVLAEQPASAAVASAEEQQKLAQLKAAQQRLDWLEAEINRLSANPPKATIAHRPDVPAAKDEAFLDENLTQWVLYGVGGLSVASLLAWLLVKRRRAAAKPQPQVSRQRSAMGPVTISASLGPDEQPLVQPIADDINLQAIDVLAEADVLMAYGRFDAAEQLLRESLANEPDREDLRMKLLDLIARKGNRREFESVALDLLAVFGPASGLWKRVLQLGAALDPENPLYRPAPDAQEHFVLDAPRPSVDLGTFAPESEEVVPLSRQVDNAEAAQDLARLYREMGDTETAEALLREAGIKA
ncbi:LysM peptidoglycan-binding domain-containing protein [Vogesella sp. DC21W]|uniref:LysM peptidoglycan-binding domain-containing protein n=1 Tax=Vogesella aquatica TaxID=2984206 RepID=A0ABT5IZ14_9NEIS|nr:LysM peptidoglycan-binding domain-containing protein [Vogesella aquatica]MDC7717807.1 LysM peptidoglycan-binding domain-containing protein [Vogesella aquatica]